MYSNLAMSLHTFPGTVRVGGGAEGSAAQCRKEGSGSSSAQPSLLYSTAAAIVSRVIAHCAE